MNSRKSKEGITVAAKQIGCVKSVLLHILMLVFQIFDV